MPGHAASPAPASAPAQPDQVSIDIETAKRYIGICEASQEVPSEDRHAFYRREAGDGTVTNLLAICYAYVRGSINGLERARGIMRRYRD